VVDNGSTKDNSVKVLKKIPGIKLVLNKANLGFAEGCNVGVRNSSASKYISLLNNDTEVDKDWLKYLVEALDSNPSLGQVMSKFYTKYSTNDFRFDHYGTATLLQFNAEYDNVDVKTKLFIPCFGASGGAQLFRRSLCKVPFDKDYFIYHEDAYFSWLVRLKGYKIATVPKSVLNHEGEATTKKFSEMNNLFVYLGERNRIMNLLLFYSASSLLKIFPLFIITTSILNLYEYKKLPMRLKSYFWLVTHIPKILNKRRFVQKQRTVADSEIIKWMLCKLFGPQQISNKYATRLVSILNKIAFVYCYLIGLRTIEFTDSLEHLK